jgi:hypothetical protein
MLPPIVNDPTLASPQNRQPEMQELTVGQPPASPVVSSQAAPPTERPSDADTDDTANLNSGGIRYANTAAAPRGGTLTSLEEARSAVGNLLQRLKQSPAAGFVAQGSANPSFISSLLQTPPAPAQA